MVISNSAGAGAGAMAEVVPAEEVVVAVAGTRISLRLRDESIDKGDVQHLRYV